ncbi:Plant peroxidase [Corchorus capsularis]|uniref:Peroxidase n=1 Tax=Corchorus capsularis TaxID=210143 RepID=A0A1R3G6R5_COCAP|nr:Plant peroxidase [Corchorus capsularis]
MDNMNGSMVDVSCFLLVEDSGDSELERQGNMDHISAMATDNIYHDEGDAESCSCDTSERLDDFYDELVQLDDHDQDFKDCKLLDNPIVADGWSSCSKIWSIDEALGSSTISVEQEQSFGINLCREFKKSLWEVPLGRRDGTISKASEALSNIPSPFFNFTTLKQSFASKGLSVQDLVVLSGGHTIGVGHCNFFSNRLYNFTGNGDQDPSLDSNYAAFLKTKCQSQSDNTTIVEMDPGSSLSFDNDYFKILKQNKGLFQSDAALLTDQGSSNIVDEMLNSNKFFIEFKKSMVNMGAIGVLTGSSGEIRKKCNVINS